MTIAPFIIEKDDKPEPQPVPPLGSRIIETDREGQIVVETIRSVEPLSTSTQPLLSSARPPRSTLAAILFGVGALGLAGMSIGDWLLNLANRHWGIAVAGAIFVGVTTLGAAIWILSEMVALRRLRKVDVFHLRLVTIGDDADAVRSLLNEIGRSLPSALTSEPFGRWSRAAPGYRGKESLDVFNKHVLAPVDEQAKALAQRASLGAALLVAIAPTAVADTAIFWPGHLH
jgi:uncharacterized membrane protein YcjF (UPF0283 family)